MSTEKLLIQRKSLDLCPSECSLTDVDLRKKNRKMVAQACVWNQAAFDASQQNLLHECTVPRISPRSSLVHVTCLKSLSCLPCVRQAGLRICSLDLLC